MDERQKEIARSLKLVLVTVVLTLISVLFVFVCALRMTGKIQLDDTLFKVLFGVAFFIPAVSDLLFLIALFNSRHAGQLFRVAFDDAILALIFSIIAGVLAFVPLFFLFIATIFDVMSIFLSVSVFFIYMLAIRTVHVENGDMKLAKRSVVIEFVYVFTELLYCIFLSVVLCNYATNPTLSFVFAIICLVCGVAGYSFCLLFVCQSIKSIKTFTPVERKQETPDFFN